MSLGPSCDSAMPTCGAGGGVGGAMVTAAVASLLAICTAATAFARRTIGGAGAFSSGAAAIVGTVSVIAVRGTLVWLMPNM